MFLGGTFTQIELVLQAALFLADTTIKLTSWLCVCKVLRGYGVVCRGFRALRPVCTFQSTRPGLYLQMMSTATSWGLGVVLHLLCIQDLYCLVYILLQSFPSLFHSFSLHKIGNVIGLSAKPSLLPNSYEHTDQWHIQRGWCKAFGAIFYLVKP